MTSTINLTKLHRYNLIRIRENSTGDSKLQSLISEILNNGYYTDDDSFDLNKARHWFNHFYVKGIKASFTKEILRQGMIGDGYVNFKKDSW